MSPSILFVQVILLKCGTTRCRVDQEALGVNQLRAGGICAGQFIIGQRMPNSFESWATRCRNCHNKSFVTVDIKASNPDTTNIHLISSCARRWCTRDSDRHDVRYSACGLILETISSAFATQGSAVPAPPRPTSAGNNLYVFGYKYLQSRNPTQSHHPLPPIST